MKKTLIRLICLIIAVFMVFSTVGCGSKGTTNQVDEDLGDFDLDFGTEDTASTEEEADASEVENQEEDKGATDTASKDTNAIVSTADVNFDSLSLKQLLTKIPSGLKGTTITVCSWNPAKEVTGAENVIAKFEKLTGIKVKWQVEAYDGYEQKVAALINSGSSPDLIRYYSPSIHRMYLCQDVKSATGFDFKGDVWDSRVTSKYTINGKIYGVNLKNTFVQQPTVMMYKKSVVDDAKIEDPYILWKNGQWTWDKFIELCKEYKEVNPSGYAWMSNDATDLVRFNGYAMISFDGKEYKNNLNDPNVYKALTQMCDYRASDIICGAVRDKKVFPQGNTLFMTFNSIANRKTNANLTEVKDEGDLYCVPIPTISGRENVQLMNELEAYGIPKGAKNPGAVYYFLRYYLDADNYDANQFFVNKQAYEVFQECMTKSEFFCSTDSELIGVVNEAGVATIGDFIRTGGASAQLKSEIDQITPTFDLAAKKANEALAKFN